MEINEQIQHIRLSLAGIGPEIFLGLFFCLFLCAELFLMKWLSKEQISRWLHNIAIGGSIVALLLVVGQWNDQPAFRFQNLLFLDRQAVFFKVLVILAWIFTLIHVRIIRYDFPSEFNSLLIATVTGLCLLTMSTHWLSIYLNLELISISSYILVALSPYKKAAEGGIKYLLFGTASSAVMLYGVSLIYGLTGTLDITDNAMMTGLISNSYLVVVATLVMTLAGLLFKLSLVPFHIWTPDVYESAPTPLVSFLSVAPKAVVVLVLMRLAAVLPPEYMPILGGIALISITIGNVAALWQTNARRLLAYSSISQAGYLLVGVVAFSRFGFESVVFYTTTYLLINMASFFMIDRLLPQSSTNLADFSGLGRKAIWSSIGLTTAMMALAGLPPTVGFTAKFLVFSSLWDSFQDQQYAWMLWLLVGGILNAAISLAYYLKLPYLLFFKNSNSHQKASNRSTAGRVVTAILVFAIIALFFKPEWLTNVIASF